MFTSSKCLNWTMFTDSKCLYWTMFTDSWVMGWKCRCGSWGCSWWSDRWLWGRSSHWDRIPHWFSGGVQFVKGFQFTNVVPLNGALEPWGEAQGRVVKGGRQNWKRSGLHCCCSDPHLDWLFGMLQIIHPCRRQV